ncbi:MAG TPA: GreA/GreB family elongation factor [Burkholderiales bacterium]|nr:GreA/GreB family elongation factor [Burkholderiales bacterium]
MSRAFIKESDEQLSADELPERPPSEHPNYVTPRGLEQLHVRQQQLQHEHAQLAEQDDPLLRQRKLETERDLRYYNAQIARATVVDPAGQPHNEVRFGAAVIIRDEQGARHEFHIVGDDEADIISGCISWASPLGKALIGAAVGDRVTWQRPAGTVEVEIVDIGYPPAVAGT